MDMGYLVTLGAPPLTAAERRRRRRLRRLAGRKNRRADARRLLARLRRRRRFQRPRIPSVLPTPGVLPRVGQRAAARQRARQARIAARQRARQARIAARQAARQRRRARPIAPPAQSAFTAPASAFDFGPSAPLTALTPEGAIEPIEEPAIPGDDLPLTDLDTAPLEDSEGPSLAVYGLIAAGVLGAVYLLSQTGKKGTGKKGKKGKGKG